MLKLPTPYLLRDNKLNDENIHFFDIIDKHLSI